MLTAGHGPGADEDKDMLTALAKLTTSSQLEFVLLWTKQRHVVLGDLQVKPAGGVFRQVLTAAIPGTNGVLTVPLGSFEPGEVAVRFAVLPFDDVPRIAAGIREGNGTPVRLAPPVAKDPFALKKSEAWDASGTHTVKGGPNVLAE